ncbi:t-SNARE [Heliocybe sulcata]|uniref:t-SNARE n=1 Tax=Heliocybe sulcata TaxID=5364 RepID=A0A5C3NKT6_9AGAM|nr:t-SNARE [Heliocybe sulcata]
MSYAYSSAPPTLSEPTTRSRTLLFRSYRDSLPRTSRKGKGRASFQYDGDSFMGDDERQGLIGSSGANGNGHVALDVEGEGEGLPPKWVDITDHVEEVLADTKQKIATLDKLHAKHALPGFADRTAEEREIEGLTNEITRNFRTAQALIQRITTTPSSSYPPQGSQHSEALAAKNVQRGLAAKVQEMSGVFRKKQRVYMEKLQGHAIKNQDLLIASGTISPPLKGQEAMHSLDEDVQASAVAQIGQDPALATRTRELHQLADSISELADLFKDLSALVIDQGTLLDSVEYNIELVATRVEDGARELQVATKYQKNTGRRKCIFLLLLVIMLLIVVLIVKPKGRRSSPPLPATPSASAVPEDVVSIPSALSFGVR